MINALLIVVWVFCGINIVFRKGISRMLFFYAGILLVPATVTPIPLSILYGHTFYAAMFIISMFIHGEFTIRTLSSPPVKYSILFILISCILIGLFDTRVGPVTGLLRGITNFISSYFLFYVGWLSVSKGDMNRLYDGRENDGNALFFRKILPITIIVTLYGLFTVFLSSNPVLDSIGLEDRFFSEDMADEGNYRAFRVTSFCVSSSVYGITCAILFLCSFSLIRYRTFLQTFAIIMLALNALLSATRAAIIPFLFGLCLFVLLNKKPNTVFKYVIILIIFLAVTVPLVSIVSPSVANYFGQMTESIVDVISPSGSGGAEFGGSSVDARAMQIAGAMQYLKEKPLFGHGFAYYSEVIFNGDQDETLLGMESYLCFIGVEYGIIYFIAVLMFYISCLSYFVRNRHTCKLYSDLGITVICMFILFLIFAWVGGCWFFVMPILGYMMRNIYLKQDMLK